MNSVGGNWINPFLSTDTRQSVLDSLVCTLALVPDDDEEFTEKDRKAVTNAEECSKNNAPIALESVLADFGLTLSDWETLGITLRARNRE